jgi:hypothetical protein
MSDLHASVTMYDFLSDIYVGLRVYDLHEPVGPSRLVFEAAEVFPGEGVDDAHDWVRNCLIALVESV